MRRPKRACVEFWLRGEPIDRVRMQSHFMDLSRELELMWPGRKTMPIVAPDGWSCSTWIRR